jgi:hypothetical protein
MPARCRPDRAGNDLSVHILLRLPGQTPWGLRARLAWEREGCRDRWAALQARSRHPNDEVAGLVAAEATIGICLRWLDQAIAGGAPDPIAAVRARTDAAHSPERNAYHEAGHAVAATLAGFPVRSVTIGPPPNPQGVGAGRFELEASEATIRRVVRTRPGATAFATLLWGGVLGEEVLAGATPGFEPLGWFKDRYWASAALCRVYDRARAKHRLSRLQARCRLWLRVPVVRAALDAVAAVLLTRQIATMADLASLLPDREVIRRRVRARVRPHHPVGS